MKRNVNAILSALLLAVCAPSHAAPPNLPSGDAGIASRYPNDVNIKSDPAVLFFDDFESYTSVSQLTGSGNWNNYYQGSNLALDTATRLGGAKSLRMRMPSTGSEVANAVVKTISPARDTLFVRAYIRYQPTYGGVNSAHNGIRVSANYGGPGRIPNGTDFFLVEVEHSRYRSEAEPGYTNAYVYHPEQNDNYGEHWYPSGYTSNGNGPDGGFGPSFVARSDYAPKRGEWLAYEVMVQANTPGSRDGRIAVWENGSLIADWQNIRFRNTTAVKINEIQLENGGQGSSQVNDKWYDNVVVATSYIGPMTTSASSQVLPPPTNLRIVPQ
jgi:hypothetical protein